VPRPANPTISLAALVAALCAIAGPACDQPGPPQHEPPPHVDPIDAGQPEYPFAGCPNEDGPLCPRSRTAQCAIDSLGLTAQGICSEDEECELAVVARDCIGLCRPVAVDFDDALESRAELQYQMDRYCSAGTCREDPCDAGVDDWYPSCYMGFCRALRPDAGPDASHGLEPDASAAEPFDASSTSEPPDGGTPELPDAGAPDA